MRNRILAGASALAMLAAGAAYAADSTTKGAADATARDQGMQNRSEQGQQAQPRSQAQPEAEREVRRGSEAKDSGLYRSYSGNSAAFTGQLPEGVMADELIGAEIVNAEGDAVAEISDLLIGADGNVEKVLADVGGFLGVGERTVAIDLDRLKMEQGSGNAFVTSMSKAEIEDLPQFDQDDQYWRMRAGDAPR